MAHVEMNQPKQVFMFLLPMLMAEKEIMLRLKGMLLF
jgi:hypothetical protein